MPKNNSGDCARLVYSTEAADKGSASRKRPPDSAPLPGSPETNQIVYVKLDRKGRGGKTVTLIEGLQLSVSASEALLRQLKSGFGTGGSIKDGVIEIQGDRRDAVIRHLEGMGCKTRRAGG